MNQEFIINKFEGEWESAWMKNIMLVFYYFSFMTVDLAKIFPGTTFIKYFG